MMVDRKEQSTDRTIQIRADISKYFYFCDTEAVKLDFAYEK